MDILTVEERSERMRAIHSRNTKPEMIVRSRLHRAGFRFRLHGAKLPGKPDVVLPRWRAVVFVHGCFWHGHPCRKWTTSTNEEYWSKKITWNKARDAQHLAALTSLGWRVFIIWECNLKATLPELLTALHGGVGAPIPSHSLSKVGD